LPVSDESVGTGIRCLQGIFLESSSSEIEATKLVRALSGKPEGTVRSHRRIVRPGVRCWYRVLLDGNLQSTDCPEGEKGTQRYKKTGFP
jgi:hypothetical protein